MNHRKKPRNTSSISLSSVMHVVTGTMEEEEIEEEEADLSSYVDDLEEDAAFEEMEEEETHADHGFHEPVTEIAASGEPAVETVVPFSSDPISGEAADVAGAEEVDDEAEEEAELEEAQAEAEALVAAEGIEGGHGRCPGRGSRSRSNCGIHATPPAPGI